MAAWYVESSRLIQTVTRVDFNIKYTANAETHTVVVFMGTSNLKHSNPGATFFCIKQNANNKKDSPTKTSNIKTELKPAISTNNDGIK